jgi:hypothetical protein
MPAQDKNCLKVALKGIVKKGEGAGYISIAVGYKSGLEPI